MPRVLVNRVEGRQIWTV